MNNIIDFNKLNIDTTKDPFQDMDNDPRCIQEKKEMKARFTQALEEMKKAQFDYKD